MHTWQRAQERQKARTREAGFEERGGLFSGKLFCADCKKAMAASCFGGKFSGYLCKTYKRQGRQFCESHKISHEELENLVSLSIMEEVRRNLTEEDIEGLRRIHYSAGNKEGQGEKALKSQIQGRIRNLARYKQGCLEQFLDGKITEEDFIFYQADYEERIKVLRQQEASFHGGMVEEAPEPDAGQEAETLLHEIETRKLGRELVNELIERIEVQKDGAVTIFFRFRERTGETVFPETKRSMCGDGGTHSGERDGICEPDE